MKGASTLVIISGCHDFQVDRFIKCLGEWEAAKDQGSFRLQTSLGRKLLTVYREQFIAVRKSLVLWLH